MSRRPTTFGVAFLDVLSCALGASVILSVIFSLIKDPPSAPVIKAFIFAEATVIGNVVPGFEIRTPNGDYVHAYPGSKNMGPNPAVKEISCWVTRSEGNVTHFYLRLGQPAQGPWLIRPYPVTFNRLKDAAADLQLDSFSYWTLDGQKAVDLKTKSTSDAPSYPFENNLGRVSVSLML
nr:hypothetical protein [Acidobacteriota bacterium]